MNYGLLGFLLNFGHEDAFLRQMDEAAKPDQPPMAVKFRGPRLATGLFRLVPVRRFGHNQSGRREAGLGRVGRTSHREGAKLDSIVKPTSKPAPLPFAYVRFAGWMSRPAIMMQVV
jgi:hypothetical protein